MNYTSTNRYLHLGTSTFSKDSFNPIKNKYSFINKPNGGLWACQYKDDVYTQIWEDYVMHRQLKGRMETLQDGFIFSIDQSAKELIIDTPDDIIDFLEKYIVICKNIENYYGRVCDSKQINWEAVAKDYDVIEFTDFGKFMYDDLFKGEFGILSVPCILIMNPDVVINIEEYHKTHDKHWQEIWEEILYDQYCSLEETEESEGHEYDEYDEEDEYDEKDEIKEEYWLNATYINERYKSKYFMNPMDKINAYAAYNIYGEFCAYIRDNPIEEEEEEEDYFKEEDYSEYDYDEYDDSQNDIENDEEYLGPYAEYYEDEYYL